MGKNPASLKTSSARGFTLMEVVVVLILLGIMAAVAISRATDNTAELRAAADRLKVHLRFAQMQAMNSDTTWGIRANGNSYFLYRDGSVSNIENLPGEQNNTISFPSGVTRNFFVSFDQWGRPYTVENPEGASPAGASISITIGETIFIRPETGFIP